MTMRSTPRSRVGLFFVLALAGMSVLPVANLLREPGLSAQIARQPRALFNLDAVARWASGHLYPLGISTDPQQVVIGRGGWLHLGDQHANTLTRGRTPVAEADLARVQQIQAAMAAWDQRLSAQGVRLFRIMIGPNKATIYPETLPEWARPAKGSVIDALLSAGQGPQYVDLKGALLAARGRTQDLLYHPTDSHWTELGAAVAFDAFAQRVQPDAPELRWPDKQRLALAHTAPRAGGDLARFLRLTDTLKDVDPRIALSDEPIKTTVTEFDSGRVLDQGSNLPVAASRKPLLVSSPSALNNKKLLWLRDSFGTAMSPMMAATFGQTLQIHWSEVFKPGGQLLRLVEAFKPDYVFITIVERSAAGPAMTRFPTPVTIRATPPEANAQGALTASLSETQQVARGSHDHEWSAQGVSPELRFTWPSQAPEAADGRWLRIALNCVDGSVAVPLKFSWRGVDGKAASVHLILPVGSQSLDLWSLPGWRSDRQPLSVALEFDTRSGCSDFSLVEPALIGASKRPY